MTDKIIAALALAGFAAFIAVLVIFVREIDLIIVSVIGLLLAGYDFYRDLFRSKNGG